MAKTKTVPKSGGDEATDVSTNDAPAAQDLTIQEPVEAQGDGGSAKKPAKLSKLGGSVGENALKRFHETGKLASGQVLKWENGVPVIYKRG